MSNRSKAKRSSPAVAGLDATRWKTLSQQIGHGYFLELERFDCGWLPLSDLREVRHRGRVFCESPALIGCALAVHRELYDDLRGFDPHMHSWGVEDLDFGLKCWLLGHPILHDPEAVIGHRFRTRFENFDAPIEHLLVNQLRAARKNFTDGVWREWVERCRRRHPGRLAEHPEGLWAAVWDLFQERRPSAEAERAYLMFRRERDEFWYAQRFNLLWPRLPSERFQPAPAAFEATAQGSPSPPPPACKETELKRFYAGVNKGAASVIGAKGKINTQKALLECEKQEGDWVDSSWVWLAAARSEQHGPVWAQRGYVRWRRKGEEKVNENRYVEVITVPLGDPQFDETTDFFQRRYEFPEAINEYECALDSEAGTWTFKFNGKFVIAYSDERWKGKVCDSVRFSGEVRHKPTQMAGTPEERVHFTECRAKVGTDWLKPSFDAGGLINDDPQEWGAKLPQAEQPRDALDIWDKKKPWWPGP